MAAELRATPQSPGWAWLAEKLGATRRALDEAFPLSPGSFLLQGTPEEVREWSYGNYPLRLQHPYTGRTASRLPSVQPGRGQALADTALLAAELTPVVGPLARVARSTAANVQSTPPLGVIKPPGGNWLAGQVEKAVAPLKQPATANTEVLAPGIGLTQESLTKGDAINKWLDQKLTRYIKNEMATPEDPLRLAAEKWATEQQPKLLAEKDAQIAKAKADMEKAQRERGVEPEVLTRSRARILELEKEREFIAARKGLHFTPYPRQPSLMTYAKEKRVLGGFPREGMATTDIAKRWEDLADKYLEGSDQAGLMTKPGYWMRGDDAERIYAENPWLFKVPPETKVFSPNTGLSTQDTGFKHMADELRNALNPESGLPPELQVSAKDLDKMTVPQVADLVDRIDAYRAVQKAEADKLAAQKSIEVYKEYPESEKGLRWVEMKMPEFKPDDVLADMTESERSAFQRYLDSGDSPREAFLGAVGDRLPLPGKKDLEEALKYEGDIMQHCVGGYCPDVVSGESRIFSLRDSTGRPHATVEVAPDPIRTWDDVSNAVGPEEAARLWREFDATSGSRIKKKDDAFLEFIEEKGLQTPAKIKQIKGVRNQKPENEYIPFVQDFVRGQRWSSVEDIQNTGLIDLRDTRRALDASGARDLGELRRLKETIKRDYVTPEELSQFRSTSGYAAGGAVRGYAAGGLVDYDPEAIERIIQDFEAAPPAYAEGSGVSAYKRLTDTLSKMTSLDTPKNMTTGETVADIAAGFVPGVGTAQAARDFERARREGDKLGMGLASVGMVPVVGGVVKPAKVAAKSLRELVDHYVRKVRKMDELGIPTYSVHRVEAPASAEVPGWHITQDLQGVLKTGALTNRDVGTGNMQGWVPAHVGGAYFYSDPRLAAMKHQEVSEMLGGDRALAAEMPILRAQLRRGNRLVPDEDVSLTVPWQESYQQGSFATTRPVLLNQVDRIYTLDPDIIKDMIRDTIIRQRNQGYAEGGEVEARAYNPAVIDAMISNFNKPAYAAGGPVRYDPAHVQGVIDRFDEEFTT